MWQFLYREQQIEYEPDDINPVREARATLSPAPADVCDDTFEVKYFCIIGDTLVFDVDGFVSNRGIKFCELCRLQAPLICGQLDLHIARVNIAPIFTYLPSHQIRPYLWKWLRFLSRPFLFFCKDIFLEVDSNPWYPSQRAEVVKRTHLSTGPQRLHIFLDFKMKLHIQRFYIILYIFSIIVICLIIYHLLYKFMF